MKYYHYTVPAYLKRIIEDGKILLSNPSSKYVKPIVWVSSNPLIELTSLKGSFDITGEYRSLTFEEQNGMVGCARIEIDPKVLIKWSVLKHKAGYKKIESKTGVSISDELEADIEGNPNEWFGSLYPITEKHFLNFEVYNGKEWVEFTDDYVVPNGGMAQRDFEELAA